MKMAARLTIGSFGLKYKKATLLVWVAMILFFAAVLVHRIVSENSIIDNSVGVWFMQDDPELRFYEQYNEDFGEREWSMLLVETASIYDPVFLMELNEITKRIESLAHVPRVISITNIYDSETTEKGFLHCTEIYPVEGRGRFATEEEIAIFRRKLHRNSIFQGSLYLRDDPRYTVVLIQNDNLIRALEPYRIRLVDAIKNIMKDYATVESYALAGTTIVNAELNRAALRDVYIFYTLITLLLILFGLLTLRCIRDLAVMFSVVIGSIIPTMGLIALLKIPFNMITVMLPTVLISLSVADIIHIINDFHSERMSHPAETAIRLTMERLWKPGLWTSLTTMVGFSSLALSTVYPIFQLGVFASLGIALAWCTTIFVTPQFLVRFCAKAHRNHQEVSGFIPQSDERQQNTRPNGIYARLLALPIPKPSRLLFTILFLVLVPCLGLVHIEVDTNYTEFFGSSSAVSKAYAQIEEAGFAQNLITIVLSFPEGVTYGAEGYFKPMLRFEEGIRKTPETIKLLSLSNLIRQMDQVFKEDDTYERVSKDDLSEYSQAQVSQLLLRAKLSGSDDIDDFISEDRTRVQLIAMTLYLSSKQLDEFKQKVHELEAIYLPQDMEVTVTGTTVLWANMDKQISRTQLLSLGAMGLFLLLFLPIVFASFRIGVLGVIANLLPLGISLGVMGYLGIEINIATALIGGISLGVVVDDTLHLIHRARLGLNEGLSWHQAIDNAVVTVGPSITMTSVILIGSFLCMATSDFRPSNHFGIFISISILIAWFLDLFVLPVILKARFIAPKD